VVNRAYFFRCKRSPYENPENVMAFHKSDSLYLAINNVFMINGFMAAFVHVGHIFLLSFTWLRAMLCIKRKVLFALVRVSWI
jgi:hypothetical protein